MSSPEGRVVGSDRQATAVVVVAVVLVGTVAVAPALAHPENETDHGVDERTFVVLWSNDEDGNVSTQTGDGELAALRQLAIYSPRSVVWRTSGRYTGSIDCTEMSERFGSQVLL